MKSTRFGIGAVGLVLLALSGAACGLKFDLEPRDLENQPSPPPDETPADETPRMCTPVVAEVTPAYEAMCRHYCGALEDTLTYAGKNTEAAGAIAESCYELRCAPRCISVDTCVQQCHALGVQYQAACDGVEIAPDTACPVTLDERVNSCLAGCGVMAPPPVDPPPTPPSTI